MSQLQAKLVAIPVPGTSKQQPIQDFSENVTFDWKINPLDNLQATDTSYLLRSPKFTCGEKVGRSSDWYISIKYSPESKHIHADISLSSINSEFVNEVYAKVTIYIMQPSKLISYKLGTVERPFTTSVDEIFRKELNKCGSCGLTTFKFRPIDAKMLTSLMVENKFIVRAELTIFKEKPTISKVPNKTLDEKTSNTDKIIAEAQALQKKEPGWERNRYTADCTIKCGDSLFPVHTHRLKSTSPIFATIFQSFEQVSDNFNENKSATLTIKNVDPNIMELILNFIYDETLDKSIWNQNDCIEIARKLLIAAESYQLFQLRDLCLMEMCNNLTLKNCAEAAIFARTLQLKPIFKKRIYEFLRKNWTTLQYDTKFVDLFNKHPQAFEFIFSPGKDR